MAEFGPIYHRCRSGGQSRGSTRFGRGELAGRSKFEESIDLKLPNQRIGRKPNWGHQKSGHPAKTQFQWKRGNCVPSRIFDKAEDAKASLPTNKNNNKENPDIKTLPFAFIKPSDDIFNGFCCYKRQNKRYQT